MVVVTFNAKRKKLLLCIAAVAVVLALLFGIRAATGAARQEDSEDIQTAASTNAERLAFLSQFGWEVKEEAVSVKEVTVPVTFSSVYTEYNKIQLEQGMDLTAYAGCTCKIWTYEVTNYPEQTETVYATLIVYDGQIIAGDISSAALDGFMHGFSGKALSESAGQPGSEPPPDSGTESSDASGIPQTESALPEDPGSESPEIIEEAEPQTSSEIETGAWPTD